MRREKYSYQEIAAVLKRSPTAISDKVVGMAVHDIEAGQDIAKVAIFYGITPSEIQIKKTKKDNSLHARKWTINEEIELLKCYQDGVPLEMVAATIKRSPKLIRDKMVEMATSRVENGEPLTPELTARYGVSEADVRQKLRYTDKELDTLSAIKRSANAFPQNNISNTLSLKKEVTNEELKDLLVEIKDLLQALVKKNM